MKTLKEVTEIVGLTRRAIQEYEKRGLASKPKHTNKYGYYLYDDKEIEKLWLLKFYKESDYNMSEIETVFKDPNYDETVELRKLVAKLKEKREKLDNMIHVAQMMEKTGLSFSSLKYGMVNEETLQGNDVLMVIGNTFDMIQTLNVEKYIDRDVWTEKEWDILDNLLEEIMQCRKNGWKPDDKEVQAKVAQGHKSLFHAISESNFFVKMMAAFLFQENEMAKDMDNEFGEGHAAYFKEALQCYAETNVNNNTDKKIKDAFDEMSILKRKNFTTDSKEVQAAVKKIHEFFMDIKIFKKEIHKEFLMKYVEFWKNEARFFSKAIDIYCKNHFLQN